MGSISVNKRILYVICVLGAGFANLAVAADEEKGRMIAERYCLMCHTPTEESSEQVAPSLSSFIDKWPLSYLEEALAEGILTGHENTMPVFTLSAEEVDDLLAYIEGLSNYN